MTNFIEEFILEPDIQYPMTINITQDSNALPPSGLAERGELAQFLRAARSRLRPETVGLPSHRRRRVPGLRREEVAELADIGVAWYTWLEQGRDVNVAVATLQRIAQALQLKPQEQVFLFNLAGKQLPSIPDLEHRPSLESLQQLVVALQPHPALLINASWDILCWNHAALELFGDFSAMEEHERNRLWLLFTMPEWRNLHNDWARYARCSLAHFRRDAGEKVKEPHFQQLINALQQVSPEFREWWSSYEVVTPVPIHNKFHHPERGLLEYDLNLLQVYHAKELQLFAFICTSGGCVAKTVVMQSNGQDCSNAS